MNDSRDTSQSVGVVSVYKVVDSDDLNLVAIRSVLALDKNDFLRPSSTTQIISRCDVDTEYKRLTP